MIVYLALTLSIHCSALANLLPPTEKGEPYPLSNLKGKVVLVVNTASKCGFTPQFEGLEKLYKKLKADGHTDDFEILGVPCNQFMQQDPVRVHLISPEDSWIRRRRLVMAAAIPSHRQGLGLTRRTCRAIMTPFNPSA